MIEIPEANVLANQLNNAVKGKRIKMAAANSSPHKFAWFFGDPEEYGVKLKNKTIGQSCAIGGRVNIEVQDLILDFHDGVNLRFYNQDDKLPKKHQLYIEFEDGTALAATVAMYGGLWCCKPDEIFENEYFRTARSAVSPLSNDFNYNLFESLFDDKSLKMSAKAFLATGQRIPGLGNGVLQDILLNAKIHPKKKINTLTESQKKDMFSSIKNTLREMTSAGGRDTEKDLFGKNGGYLTKLSKNTVLGICRNCGGNVKKESYLGGSIYYCDKCQEK